MDAFVIKRKRDDDDTISNPGSSSRSRSVETEQISVRPIDQPPAPKAAKRLCKYRKEYTDTYPFIVPSRRGDHFVFCTMCRSDLSIRSGGKNDIAKHISSAGHISASKCCVDRVAKVNSKFASECDLSVINAEVIFTKVLLDSNIPLACSDKFSKVVKHMFPDSKIAEKYSCGRTKTTAIAYTLARQGSDSVALHMQNNPYSISTDGSNNGDMKLYPLVVRHYSPDLGQVVVKILSVPSIESSSTAENISKTIFSELAKFKVPFENCVAFSADNANVMLGQKGGVAAFLTEKKSDIHIVGCPCHLINIAAKKCAKELSSDIQDLLVDVFYHFKYSDKRKSDFANFQTLYSDEAKKVLKYCATRWLCLTPCLTRLVELWKPLLEYFRKIVEEEEAKKEKKTKKKDDGADSIVASWFGDRPATSTSKSKETKVDEIESRLLTTRAKRILLFLEQRKNLILCAFVLWTIPMFEKTNAFLQSGELLIHKTRAILSDLYKNLLTFLIKPSVIDKAVNVLDINFDKEDCHLPDRKLDLGSLASQLMEKVSSKQRAEIFSEVKAFFIAGLRYMKRNFPIKDATSILVKAEIADVSKKLEAGWEFLEYFFKQIKTLKCSQDELRDEFRAYQAFKIPPEITSLKREDEKWHALKQYRNPSDNRLLFDNLAQVMLAILCIPHSNADSERVAW